MKKTTTNKLLTRRELLGLVNQAGAKHGYKPITPPEMIVLVREGLPVVQRGKYTLYEPYEVLAFLLNREGEAIGSSAWAENRFRLGYLHEEDF